MVVGSNKPLLRDAIDTGRLPWGSSEAGDVRRAGGVVAGRVNRVLPLVASKMKQDVWTLRRLCRACPQITAQTMKMSDESEVDS